MKRRTFIKKNAIVTLAPFITTGLLARNKKIKSLSEKPFQLNYAPHFGMFESMAGKDLMDQIQFMHDQGFRSLEDNGMKKIHHFFVLLKNRTLNISRELDWANKIDYEQIIVFERL